MPNILLTPNNAISAKLIVYPDQQSVNGFDLGVIAIPKSNTTYQFDYLVTQNLQTLGSYGSNNRG